MNLEQIQSALREQQVDGWLFYDHHHRDPIAYRILGLSDSLHVSRRWYYFIPAEGQPRKLTHRIESGKLASLPGSWATLLVLAGARSRPAHHARAVQEAGHAVLATQRHHVRLAGRCGNDRSAAGHGQDHRQLRRPGEPLRGRPDAGADRQPLRGSAVHRRNRHGCLEAHRYAAALRQRRSAKRI